MDIILAFLTFLIILMSLYMVIRFFKRPGVFTLLALICQIVILTVAVLSVLQEVYTIPWVEISFIVFGIMFPSVFIIYDYRKMVRSIKEDGKFKGFIQTIPKKRFNAFDPNKYNLELESLAGEIHTSELKQSLDISDNIIKENFETMIVMAQKLLNLKRYEAAYDKFKFIAQICSENPYIVYNCGNLCLRNGRYKEAYKHYKRSLTLFRNIQTRGQDFEEVKGSHNSLVINGFEAMIHYNIGIALFKLDKYEHSILHGKKALEKDSAIYKAKRNIAKSYMAMDNKVKALEYYRDSLQDDLHDAEILYVTGKLYFELNEYDNCIADLEQAVKTDATLLGAWELLGRVSVMRQDYSMGVTCYERLLHINPHSTEYMFNMGICYYQMKNFEQALIYYDRALSISPDDFKSLYNAGKTSDELGRQDEAVKYLRKAVELNPKSEDAVNELGIILSTIKRHREAIRVFQEALKYHPRSYRIYYNMAIALMQVRRIQDAITAFKKAISLNQRETEIYYHLSAAYMQYGDYVRAAEYYRKCLNLKPEDTEVLYGLAKVYCQMGERDIALKTLEKAINADEKCKYRARNTRDFAMMQNDARYRKMIS